MKMICENPYCEADATHEAPHNERYCSECIHEHVYDERDPDPANEIVRCQNGVGEWEIYPTGETFDTREEAETRLAELKAT